MTRLQQRIIQALNETNRYIEREEKRSEDLRPAEVAATLNKSRAHREKLVNLLGKSDAEINASLGL